MFLNAGNVLIQTPLYLGMGWTPIDWGAATFLLPYSQSPPHCQLSEEQL